MTDTILKTRHALELLTALDWFGEGRVHSASPTDDADVWLRRGERDDEDITVQALRMKAAGLVERVQGGTAWRLTDVGTVMRNGVQKYAGSAS